MAPAPLISICIPAYKRREQLRRLLESIAIQSFRDFEVVITDDSPGEEIGALVEEYSGKFILRYQKNIFALGSPENWNEGIRMAQGQWIKPMHDDDWFADEGSLQAFAAAIGENPDSDFLFSAYRQVFEDGNSTKVVYCPALRLSALRRNPASLFSRNVVGPPSVVIYKKNPALEYDRRMRWLVDIDYYMRCLEKARPTYMEKPLVKIGLSSTQVTQSSFGVASVEIPESFLLLSKLGPPAFGNLYYYDGWWRLLRNLRIRSTDDLLQAGYSGEIDPVIKSMIHWQHAMPAFVLRTGPLSKIFMIIHWLMRSHFAGTH